MPKIVYLITIQNYKKGPYKVSDSLKVAITNVRSDSLDVNFPKYATDHSAGMDIHAAITQMITLAPGESTIVPSGLAVALPEGYEMQIRPRSGLAAKKAVTVLNSPGTIDADYRGEIGVILINHGKDNFEIEPNMRIAQMVITEYTRVEWDIVDKLDSTERGEGGFGSTGTAG